MFKQGWNHALRITSIATFAVLLSGCQTVRQGHAHPFYTLFSHAHPSVVRPNMPAEVGPPVFLDQPVTEHDFSADMPPWFQLPAATAELPAQEDADCVTQL
jgi:hypothetical protein